MTTKTSAAPALTDRQIAETFDAVEAAYDAGRFLTAQKLAVAEFGSDLFAWPGDLGRVWAVRMASRLGGYQLSNALQFGLARRGPASAEGIYNVTSFQLGRKPLARFWLEIKDRDLTTDDARLAARWLTLKARIMAGVRDFDRSTALMDAAIATAPDEPTVHLTLAGILAHRDDLDNAIDACHFVAEMQPGFALHLQPLAGYLTGLGRVDEAIELLRDAVSRTECGYTRLQLAATLIRRQRHAEAAELIDRVERFFPLIDPINKKLRRAKRGSLLSQIASLRSDAFVEQGKAAEAIRWAGLGSAKRLQNPRMSSREGLGV